MTLDQDGIVSSRSPPNSSSFPLTNFSDPTTSWSRRRSNIDRHIGIVVCSGPGRLLCQDLIQDRVSAYDRPINRVLIEDREHGRLYQSHRGIILHNPSISDP